MIKKGTGKKKKGFTLIELVIVLAVMAIIALIAIPNFSAIRDNSKNKADKESCEVIKRTTLMLVSDETVKVKNGGTVIFKNNVATIPANTFDNDTTSKAELEKALHDVKDPQGKTPKISNDGEWTYEDKAEVATQYEIKIQKGGDVTVVPSTAK